MRCRVTAPSRTLEEQVLRQENARLSLRLSTLHSVMGEVLRLLEEGRSEEAMVSLRSVLAVRP